MSYSNNPTSILAGTGITVTPTTGTGSNTITISATAAGVTAIRTAVATPITVVAATDNIIDVAVPGPVPVAVTLPVGVLGQEFTIKDGLGLASPATPITITATAGTIDGAATAVINAPYGSLTFVYNGTQWLIL
jgi:hypothetical protein